MKILAFTDNHTLNTDIIGSKAADVDLVVCLGDMSLMGHYLEHQLDWMNGLGKPVLVIPGNHESYVDFKGLVSARKNLINMQGKIHVIGDVVFMGFGNEGFAQREPAFEKLVGGFGKAVESQKVSILLHHGPPYNTELDYLPRFDPAGHRGCISIREFIDTYQPTYALSGHLHETFGIKQKLGKTTCWNVGDEGVVIEV